jgi:hypothetical protein
LRVSLETAYLFMVARAHERCSRQHDHNPQ